MIRPECGGGADTGPTVRRRIALQDRVARQHELREPVRARLEMAVGIGQQQRHVEEIRVGDLDAELGRGLCLDLAPVSDVANHFAGDPVGAGPAEPAVQHLAVLNRLPADHHVLTQEHLVGRMRGVGLVLIHPRCRLVDPVVVRVDRRPRHSHRVEGGVDARAEQRVIRLQRHEDRAVAALVHQVEAVVEELTEEREHQVERRGETEVGRDVRDEERTGIKSSRKSCGTTTRITQGRPRGAHKAARAARVSCRRGGGRVGRRLVEDQVADDTRLGVDDVDVCRRRVRGPCLRSTEVRSGQAREELVGRTKQVLIGNGHEVVERPVDGPQAERELRFGAAVELDLVWSRSEERPTSRMILGDFDRMKDEPQVAGIEREPLSDRGCLRVDRRHEGRTDHARDHRDHRRDRPPLGRTNAAACKGSRSAHDRLLI